MNTPPKILVLDNVLDSIQALSGILKENGYDVIITDNNQDINGTLESCKPDLIFLNTMMPEVDVYNVFSNIKHSGGVNIPVILVMPEEKANEGIFGNDGVDYVTKPFRVSEILARTRANLKVRTIIEQKLALQKELQTSQKIASITTLAGEIAHNINNLMGAIVGYSDLLRIHLNDSKKSANFAEKILEASQRVTELTYDIIKYSRSIRSAPVSVNVKNLIENMMLLYGDDGIKKTRVDIEVPENIPEIYVDKDQICRALASIFIKVKETTPENSTITITACMGRIPLSFYSKEKEPEFEEYVVISIKNTGNGIDEDIAKKLSDSFFIINHVIESELELSAASSIIRKNKGFIQIDTKPGIGSIFHLYLPKSNEERP